jgi:ribosome biogenesis GTPase
VTGHGIAELRRLLADAALPALVGHSGVGKSALLNRLDPSLKRAEGTLSRKYDRGAHTTRYGEMVVAAGVLAIDTPGIRELEISDIEPQELRLWYRDFLPYVEDCEFPGCLCAGEPGCAVRTALQRGEILRDRYLSYRRILGELQAAVAERR